MAYKRTQNFFEEGDLRLVDWKDSYSVGIKIIDDENKRIIAVTNDLYEKCRSGSAASEKYFSGVINRVVDYIKEHFAIEEELLKEAGYPEFRIHKKEHDDFVRYVVASVKEYQAGRPFVPNRFARYLKEWTLEHIAVSDRKYKEYMCAHRDTVETLL